MVALRQKELILEKTEMIKPMKKTSSMRPP